ncbi:MAG: hypothetical protein ACTSQJ_08780 [Promethearchaeota archaeon]
MIIGLKKNTTPITQIQTHISDFSDNLKPFCNLLEEKLEGIKNSKKSEDSRDEFILLPGNLVRLRNEKCREHDIPLTKNGTDNRTVYTSDRHIFKNFKDSVKNDYCCTII